MGMGSLRASIFTMMSASIGPGALLLPHMFRLVGLPAALLCILFGAFCNAQSLRFVITIAHLTGCDSYPAGVAAILGPWAGAAVCHVMNFVLLLGIGQQLRFLEELMPRALPSALVGLLPPQLAAIALVFPISASRDISVLRHVALVAPLALIYVIALIVWTGLSSPLPEAAAPPRGLRLLRPPATESAVHLLRFGDGGFWGLPQAWSIFLNALSCHHVAVPVYRQLHCAGAQRVNKVVLRSTASLSFLYALVGASGFLAHGAATPENILLVYPVGDRAALIAQVLVGCTLIVAIPLNVHAVRGQVSGMLHPRAAELLQGTAAGRALFAAALLALTALVGRLFPSISSIIGIACGFGVVVYIFVVPAAALCSLRWSGASRAGAQLQKFDGALAGSSGGLQDLLQTSPLSMSMLAPDQRRGMVNFRAGRGAFADVEDVASPLNGEALGGPRQRPVAFSPGAAPWEAATAGCERSPSGSSLGGDGAEWSPEFAISVVALLAASGLGLASASRTVVLLWRGQAGQ